MFCRKDIAKCLDASTSTQEIRELLESCNLTLASIVRGSSTPQRKAYLKALWACYEALPAYVHSGDPKKCNFADEEKYDGYSLMAKLGEVFARYFGGELENPSVFDNGKRYSVELLQPDSKLLYY